MAYYNFDKINSEIPIEEVLALHGIFPKSNGWYSLRADDDTPSSRIDPQRRYGNTVHDFGLSNTFNPITLTVFLRDLEQGRSKEEAMKLASQILGDAFGIQPEASYKTEQKESNFVSDHEWRELLIYPEAARKNMTFYPEKFGIERTKAYADKYSMSMSELRKMQDPENVEVYEKIVRTKGVSHVLELKNIYFSGLYSWHEMRKELNIEFNPEELLADADISRALKELNFAQSILMKAIDGTSIKFKPSNYNIIADFEKVVNGKISFEIGQESHYDIKTAAYQANAKVFYCLVSVDEYYKLMSNGLNNLRTAAFRKGDEVNFAFISTDSSRVNYLVKALRGKEFDVSPNVSNNKEENKDNIVRSDNVNNKNDVVMDV